MYAIAFFTTVILFSASLYIGHKFVEIATHFDDAPAKTDIDIRPVATHFHMGHYRFSA